jgi:hypothetical protein
MVNIWFRVIPKTTPEMLATPPAATPPLLDPPPRPPSRTPPSGTPPQPPKNSQKKTQNTVRASEIWPQAAGGPDTQPYAPLKSLDVHTLRPLT